ncbi:MAG: alpha/beta fold hydrolase [Chloroflexota bacterium]
MTHEQNGFININGGELYYEIGGAGDMLVLDHAGFVDSGMWNDQWSDFTKHFQVIRYDMRGFGKSDPANGSVCRRDDLYQLLKHLDVKAAHILGCSMGGTNVIDFALEHPDMVKSLTVVSATPSGFELQGAPPPHMMEMIQAAQKGDIALTSELQIRIWVDGMYRQPEQVDPQVRAQAAAMNIIPVQNNTFAADAQPLNPLNPPAVGRLDAIHVPTLVIAGALDHPEILRAADVMQQGIQGAKKVVIPEAAHVPNMEQPGLFNAAVLDFLKG